MRLHSFDQKFGVDTEDIEKVFDGFQTKHDGKLKRNVDYMIVDNDLVRS